MKKIVEQMVQYSVNGEPWDYTTFFPKTKYMDESELGINWQTGVMDFQQTLDFIKTEKFTNARVDTTLFRKRPVIVFPNRDIDKQFRYTEKEIKTVEVRKVTYEVTGTITDLAKSLSSEEFIEYLKDRGIDKI
jgi:hypothetical protein